MLTTQDQISTVPDLKCRFCDMTLRKLGIQDMERDDQLAKVLAHYRQRHAAQFHVYCASPDPVRPDVIRLLNQGLVQQQTDKQAALDTFLECERLLYTDSLLLAVRLGTHGRVQDKIRELAELLS